VDPNRGFAYPPRTLLYVHRAPPRVSRMHTTHVYITTDEIDCDDGGGGGGRKKKGNIKFNIIFFFLVDSFCFFFFFLNDGGPPELSPPPPPAPFPPLSFSFSFPPPLFFVFDNDAVIWIPTFGTFKFTY